jgi:hypothetical protein
MWVYFADRAGVIFTDDSHFIGAAVADRFVVALAKSDELDVVSAEDALKGHVEN